MVHEAVGNPNLFFFNGRRRNLLCLILQTSLMLKILDSYNNFSLQTSLAHNESATRSHLSASDVGFAVDASIARSRADLLRLNIVVVSAGVLVADVLDAADVDLGESGSVAVVRVDT
jgi:hypothetical protein